MHSAVIAIAFAAFSLQAQQAQQGQPSTAPVILTATAVRAASPPQIDGRDDDAVWQQAPKFTGFRQFEPKVDTTPSFPTEFRAAYDERNLYVFVRMFDPHPDSIMHALSRRDVRGPSDQIKLLIDSYNDRRSGFEFAVNPDGVKRDYSMSNDGNEDESWNGVWDVGTRVDSLGWTAEFRIPLSQLRYTAGTTTFGFGIWRDIERYRERSSWPLYHPQRAGLSSQLGRLEGMAELSTARRIEATPYVVAKNVQRITPTSDYDRVQELTAGGDLKIGITPNVTLDATINPDFGQVESDPSVVNLTAFETFLYERRPFFVEGTGLYRFELNCYIVVDCSTNEGLFYSRRIGRFPSLRGEYGDETTPTSTTIAAATKLTGRTRRGLAFGVLDAVTREVTGINRQIVEPLTNYGVVRVLQDFRGGDADIGLIGTAVNRSDDQWTRPFLHRAAYSAGATFRNRFSGRRYELAGQLAGSHVSGTREAILRTQRSSVHYYQQPGDDPQVDSTRESLSGYSAQLKLGKYSGGITRFETSVIRMSPGFEANDLGFLRRADIMDWSTWAALSFREARGIYRWAQINGNHWETWNTSGLRLENAVNFNGHIGTKNNWDFHAGGTMSRLGKSYDDRETRGGPPLRQSRRFSPWAGFNTDSRKMVSGGIFFNWLFADEGKTDGTFIDPYVTFRFGSPFQLTIGGGFGRDHNDSQWFGNFTDTLTGVTHYSFAHLDYQETSISARMNYTMTPNLTLELYARPFRATGVYTNFREVGATPGAEDYDARFQPYTPPPSQDTQFKFTELISNSVVRWEFRPGSTLFVVWQHGREGPGPDDRFRQSWMRDYRELFGQHPDNTFLVKLAYWFSN
ncbi:MAG TPA: DUF5916 domain-containing protein [Gemmatimonadaceae bacterium]|nr:DUF5916 domain-containing protein [Gemmatimonadaceae bacterium]